MTNFNKNIVTERFINAFNELKDCKFFDTNKEFADNIEYLPQSLGEILKGRRDVTIDVIRKLVIKYPVSLDYIFKGEGEVLSKNAPITNIYHNDNNGQVNGQVTPSKTPESGKTNSTTFGDIDGHLNGHLNGHLTPLKTPESGKTNSTTFIELPVPLEPADEMVAIPVVDISVAAGSGYYNPDMLSEIDCIRLPKTMIKNSSLHLCVRIKGESMIPTLQDGGYLIIQLLEPSEWQSIQDGHVYVVSDKDGRAFVKRLKNRLLEYGFIVCMSDNPDPMGYPSFNLMENEIVSIWHAEWYISAKMPNIHATYYNKVGEIENEVFDLRRLLESELRQIRSEIKAIHQGS